MSEDTLLPCPWCAVSPNSGCNYGIGGAYVNCVNQECPANPEVFIAANHTLDASLSLDDALIKAKAAWNAQQHKLAVETTLPMEDASTRKDEGYDDKPSVETSSTKTPVPASKPAVEEKRRPIEGWQVTMPDGTIRQGITKYASAPAPVAKGDEKQGVRIEDIANLIGPIITHGISMNLDAIHLGKQSGFELKPIAYKIAQAIRTYLSTQGDEK